MGIGWGHPLSRIGWRLDGATHSPVPRKCGWPHTLPETLEIRELRVRVTRRGFRTRVVVVVTTLLDADIYTKSDLAALYRQRWHAELDLRSIKIALGMDVLRCKTPEMVRKEIVGVHRCSCGYPPSPRGGPALWETLKVATFAIPQSHSVDCKAERVRPGRCGNDTPIVPSASWRRSKTVTRNGRRTSPRRRGTSRLTAGTSGVRCCASKTPVGISRLYLCAARRHTPEL